MRKGILFLMSIICFAVQIVNAQTREITGRVTDAQGTAPLSGVTVKAKNASSTTQTDTNGNFRLQIPENVTTLVFTYVGYDQQEVAVTGNTVEVSLKQGAGNLSEVVVTGYVTRTRRATTGATSTVVVDDIRQQPQASFDQLLQGQAAGLNVKSGSGQPGRSADVIIRGRTSVLGSVTPLYIVDGIEVRAADFSTINPGDFETITVLKDASTTALYGSRGANGVIVVTTKRGRSGKARFQYDGQVGYSMLPKNNLELMNTQEKLDFEMNIAGNPWGWTQADVDSLRNINENWNDAVFRTGRMQSHQISASGGNEKTQFYTSLSLFDQEGVAINTGLKRYTGRLNLTQTEEWVKFGMNLTGGWSSFIGTNEGNQSVGAPLNTVLWALPYERAFAADGSYTNSVQFPFWLNPVEQLQENPSKSWQLKSNGNVFADFKIPGVKGLMYRINAGGDYSQSEGFNITKNGTQSAAQSAAFGTTFAGQGSVARSLDRRFRFTITNSLGYRGHLDKAQQHSISATVFSEYLGRSGRSFNYTGYGLLLPIDNEAGLVAGTAQNGFIPIVGGGFPDNSRLLSYFGLVDYSFKNRYFLTLSGRTDGSSRLSPTGRWTQYGSVGAGWVISDESFFKTRLINYLKLRGAYGAAGNQDGIGDFPFIAQYSRGTYGGQGTLQVSRFSNSRLTWELRKTANVGLDFQAFNNRLRGSVEGYNSVTSGLYFNPNVPATSGGLGTLTSNTGSMRNRGFEVTLGVRVLDFNSFKWNVDINYAYNQNEILELPDGQNQILYGDFQVLQVGKPLNSFYLVRYNGVNPANGNSQYLKADGKTITEEYDAEDLVPVGTSDAPHNAGITNTFSWKGLELSALLVFNYGNYVYNNARFNLEFYQYTTSGFARNGLTAWQRSGDVTNFPRIDEATQGQTTRFLEKGDFVRLRNVMLSYSIPQSLTKRLRMQGLRVFAQGQNLVTWHNFQGWDPEVSTVVNSTANSNAAVSGAQYPPLRTVNFGLTLNF